jgi:hypothetical protein
MELGGIQQGLQCRIIPVKSDRDEQHPSEAQMIPAFRLPPSESPIEWGRQYQLRFYPAQNTSDPPVMFGSETWRQEDRAERNRPDRSTEKLLGTWYSGLPIMMHWILAPGDIAKLSSADLGVTYDP